jgi:hypothetical protein
MFTLLRGGDLFDPEARGRLRFADGPPVVTSRFEDKLPHNPALSGMED